MPRSPSLLTPDGLWVADYTSERSWPERGEVTRAENRARSALFLDRDGCLIEERNYLAVPEGVTLLPGAAAVVARANRLGVAVVVVTNQSGIGRGRFGWADFAAVEARLVALLEAEGARPDMTLACPFHPSACPPWRAPDHPARKPRPGMLLEAATRLRLDLARSWIAGDKADDLSAGRAAGLAGGLHVASGHGGRPGERAAALALARADFEVRAGPDLRAALALPLL